MLLFMSLLAYATGLVKDCNTSSIFRPTTLGLTPDPPIIGQQVRLSVLFYNPGPVVSDGIATTYVTLNYLPMTPNTEALCQNTACPLMTGSNDRSVSATWPDVKGTVVMKSVWKNVMGDELLCLLTTVKSGVNHLRLQSQNISNPFRDDVSLKQVALWFDHRVCNNTG